GRSPSCTRCITTGSWAWRRCWCGTSPPRKMSGRTRSWRCMLAGSGCGTRGARSPTCGRAWRTGSGRVCRHGAWGGRARRRPAPDMPSAEHGALVQLERSAVIATLRKLPGRQREAIVLRYYADLSEAEIAAAMGISCGAVKSHTARAMAALRADLEQQDRAQ